MRLKKYSEFIKEELRQDEMDSILDKISKSGRDSLTDEEEKKLSEFDGNYDDTPLDEVEIDAEGDIRVNGKRYNPYGIPDEFYDGDEKTMDDYKPTDLDEDLRRYIDRYLQENFEKRQVAGAHQKQIFDKDGNMIRPGEVVQKTLWDMEISDVKGCREYIKQWMMK